MVKISVSILNIKDDWCWILKELALSGIDFFHIDVMDWKFVMNNTKELMLKYSSLIKGISDIPLDVHLMTYNVKYYVDEFLEYNPSFITFHFEALESDDEVTELINYIKSKNIKVWLSVNPSTKVEKIYKYLSLIDIVLVMTVEPWLWWQKLIPSTIDKIKELKSYIKNNNLYLDIEVDWWINLETSKLVKEAWANILVSWSAIINSDNFFNVIEALSN